MPWALTGVERAAARATLASTQPIQSAINTVAMLDELAPTASAGTCQAYAAGETIANPTGDLWFVASGTVALRSADRFHRVVKGPSVLSPAYFGTAAPDILALTDGAVLGHLLPATVANANNHDQAWCDASMHEASADLEHARMLRERLYVGMKDHFEPDGSVSPGPYTSTMVRMCMLLVEDPSPPPLPWNVLPLFPASGRYFLVLTEYQNFSGGGSGTPYSYRELAYLIPCMTSLGVGFHTERLFPDGVMPTAVGREMYAFPKTFGQVWLGGSSGGAAANGKLHVHAEWSPQGTIAFDALIEQMAEAMLPPVPVVPNLAGLLAKAFQPVLTSFGFPMRIYTEREGRRSPMSPLGHAETVRAPTRFIIKGTRQLQLDSLHHATKPGLVGLGAWDLDVDMKLHEAYAVTDRSRALRTPWLRAQIPIRTLVELFT